MQKPMRLLLCASTAAFLLSAAPMSAFITPAEAQVVVTISASIAPPLLPVYAQPPIPGPGYLWVPGYWAWTGTEYYWVPGYWATPPMIGLYWTPPYWAWVDGAYVFNAGYWGPTVGFYGGVNYGFGYTGYGYQGGFWRNNVFVYNRTVNNFGAVTIANSFSRPVPNPNTHVAFNGGAGGTTARPTQAQIAARASGKPPTAEQAQHQQAASRDPALGFKANHGAPPVTAMQRANEFHGGAAATAAPAARPQTAPPAPAARPQTAAPAERPQAATPAPAARPQAAARLARPQAAPPAPTARPQAGQHAAIARQAPTMHARAIHTVTGTRIAPPMAGTHMAPPMTGMRTAPPMAGMHTAPPMAGAHMAPPMAGMRVAPPMAGMRVAPHVSAARPAP
jgi:hypothetical protein